MSANAIDITTLEAVKNWVQIPDSATGDDSIIQDCITAFSAYAIRATSRGPGDGSIPSASPFVSPQNYDDVYDGSGTMRQPIRNWPITAVSSVTIDGAAVPQSTSINVWGYVVDGDAKFISLRGGFAPSVATFQNYRYQGGRYGYGAGMQGPGFSAGVQNVEVIYTAGFAAIPFDLEMLARKVVSLNYKRRGWIGQRSQAMAQGAGTVFYNDWAMDKLDADTLMFYKRNAA